MTLRNISEELRGFLENNPAVAPQEREYAQAVNSVVFDSEAADYTETIIYDDSFGGWWRRQEGDPIIDTTWRDTRLAPADVATTGAGTHFDDTDGILAKDDYDGGDEEYTLHRSLLRFELDGNSGLIAVRNARIRLWPDAVKAGIRVAVLQGPTTFDVNSYDDMLALSPFGVSDALLAGQNNYIQLNYEGLKYCADNLAGFIYLAFLEYDNDFLNVPSAGSGFPGVTVDYTTNGRQPQIEFAV